MIQSIAYDVEGWGIAELWLDGEVVVTHESPRPLQTRQGSDPCHVDGACGAVTSSPRDKTGSYAAAFSLGFDSLIGRVRAYFAGARDDFHDVELDLEWCTPFQRDVAVALRGVPYGEVVTYGELAALAGYPRAHRAAASFCAQSRYSLFVPCHRVVASDGIGGYGSLGVEYKRRLLALEHVSV